MKIKIEGVTKNSIAEEIGIEKGDFLVTVNDKEVIDVLDYKYLISDEDVVIVIEKQNGEVEEIEIQKDENEDLGIVFKEELIDKPRRCANHCIFCFMDQLPENVRNTLVYKDDDYRLSFLTGNYVTMTNMIEKDIDRIIKYHLSPINISIHATDVEVRAGMLRNKNAHKVFEFMKKLNEAGIYMNGQIVLCKNINDGKVLEKTLTDIEEYFPNLRSVSIVPVGLSKFRENLFKLESFNKEDSIEVIKLVEKFQKKYKEKYGSVKVFLSDEWYVNADMDVPSAEDYDGFPQLENGVGLIASFEEDFKAHLNKIKTTPSLLEKVEKQDKTVTILTGKIAEKHIKKHAKILEENFKNIHINVLPVENKYMGEKITVTGLVVGEDIANLVNKLEKEKYNFGDYIIISDIMLKDDEDIFLDDMTLKELKEKINTKLIVAFGNPESFIETILYKM